MSDAHNLKGARRSLWRASFFSRKKQTFRYEFFSCVWKKPPRAAFVVPLLVEWARGYGVTAAFAYFSSLANFASGKAGVRSRQFTASRAFAMNDIHRALKEKASAAFFIYDLPGVPADVPASDNTFGKQ